MAKVIGWVCVRGPRRACVPIQFEAQPASVVGIAELYEKARAANLAATEERQLSLQLEESEQCQQ